KKRKLSTMDLLSRVDPKKDGITGTWKQAGPAVIGAGGMNLVAKLASSYTPPEEYDLTIEATRKDGAEDLSVGLIGGGKQFAFVFDTGASSYSGPDSVNNAGLPSNGL